MGVELATLGTVFSIVSGGLSVYQGLQQQQEGNAQAEILAQQAEARAIEEERIAYRQARAEQEQTDLLAKRQKVAFLSSGVDLAGSPLLVMEETRRIGRENVQEILAGGSSAADALRAEGRLAAQRSRDTGRQAFFSGLTQGASTIGGRLA